MIRTHATNWRDRFQRTALRLLRWYTRGKVPHTLRIDGSAYLERWTLPAIPFLSDRWEPDTEKRGPFVFLHRFRLPDFERFLHNHPSEYQFSILLVGGYLEERFCRRPRCVERGACSVGLFRRILRAPAINWIDRETFHRVAELRPFWSEPERCKNLADVLENGEVWSLFVMGPKHGESWGFLVPGRGLVSKKQWDREHGAAAPEA